MKGSGILHGEISQLIALLGHGQKIAISDYGLPVPTGVRQIDLAVRRGLPDFLGVVETVLSELRIEGCVIAEELKTTNPQYLARLTTLLDETVTVGFLTHEDFKRELQGVEAVIRTGEWTPYANIILRAGVTF